MYGSYNGYKFSYEVLENGKIKASSAFCGNFQCSYGIMINTIYYKT